MLGHSDLLHVEAFLYSLRQAGLSAGTRQVYKSAVVSWLGAGGRPGHVDAALLRAYIGKRRAQLSVSTCNGDLKVLRRFYRFQAACGHCPADTLRHIPKGRPVPRRLPRALSLDQIAAVLTQPDATTWIGYRDTVLLRVLADTGLRTTQVAALTLGSVLDSGELYIGRSHKREDRYIAISAELHAMLETYIARRREVRPGKRSDLFVTQHGRPLSPRTIYKRSAHHISAALGRITGCCMTSITGRPWQGQYPHMLRASLAQAYLERGLPITTVAQLLGLSSAQSLSHYAGVDLKPLRAAVAKHPRGGKANH